MRAELKRQKKVKLFREQGGRCHWCGRPMRLSFVHERQTPDLATFDHLDSRPSGMRGAFPGVRRVVLACHACNHARGKVQEKEPSEPRLLRLALEVTAPEGNR